MKKLILFLCLLGYLQGVAQPDPHTPRYWFGQYEAARSRNESLQLQLQYLQNATNEGRTRREYHRDHCFHYARVQHALRNTQVAYDFLRQNVLNQDPNDHEANDLLGLVCQGLSRWEEALIALHAAVEERPRNPTYRLHRAQLFNQLALERRDARQYDAAILDFNEARRRETDRDGRAIMYQVYYGRGISYLGKGNLENAVTDFRKSLVLNPDSLLKAKTFSGLAQILYRLKQYPAAIDTFNRAITLDNQLHDAFDGRGLCYLESDKISEAFADFSNAIEITPLKTYHYHRSLAYTRQRNYRAALSDLNIAITAIQGRMGDSTAQHFFQRGFVQYHLKNYGEAQTDLTTAIRLDNNLVTGYCYRGWTKVQIAQQTQLKEDFLRAIPDFNKALQIQPVYALAYAGRGLAQYYSLPSLVQAKEDLDKAINQDPKLAIAYLGRGKLRSQTMPEEAIRDFDQVIYLDKEAWEAYILRSQLQLKEQHYSEAESDLNILIRNFPDSVVYNQLRGMTRFHLGRYDTSLEDLQRHLQGYPNNVNTLLYIGRNQLKLERYAMSAQLAQRLKQLAPTDTAIIAFQAIASQYYLDYRKQKEKATIQWHAPIRLNGNDLHFQYYMDTTYPNPYTLALNASVQSMSDAQIQLTFNGQVLPLRQRRHNDSVYTFELKCPLRTDSTNYLELSVRNQAGDTVIQKEIGIIRQPNACPKPQRGFALVIGNQNYDNNADYPSLKRSIHDAKDVADSLRRIGFQVITLYDGNLAQMRDAFDNFVDSLKDYEIGFFYYSGHGEQQAGVNYLIPSGSVTKFKYNTRDMFEKLNETRLKSCQLILLLDACRTTSSSGFNRTMPSLPENTVVCFSADTYQSASDESGNNLRNGRYASYLLPYLTRCNLRFDDILMRVCTSVTSESEQSSDGLQTPIYMSSLKYPIYLCR